MLLFFLCTVCSENKWGDARQLQGTLMYNIPLIPNEKMNQFLDLYLFFLVFTLNFDTSRQEAPTLWQSQSTLLTPNRTFLYQMQKITFNKHQKLHQKVSLILSKSKKSWLGDFTNTVHKAGLAKQNLPKNGSQCHFHIFCFIYDQNSPWASIYLKMTLKPYFS